jgi:hypothetical protein
MATKNWEVAGHSVTLTQGFWSGEAEVVVDGRVVFSRPRTLFDFGFTCRCDVARIPCAVRVHPTVFSFRRELIVGEEAAYVRSVDPLPIDWLTLIEIGVFGGVLLGWVFFW